MKTPITIAVLALHVAIITTILAQQGCSSTEDVADVNPDLSAQTLTAKNSIDKSVLPEGDKNLRANPTRPAEPFSDGLILADNQTNVVGLPNEDLVIEKEKAAVLNENPVSQETKVSDVQNVAPVIYKVQKGDSLSKIAAKYGVKLADLMEANSLDKNSILQIGQEIKIPNGATVESNGKQNDSVAVNSLENAAQTTGVYIVKRGDSLSKIAVEHKTSIRAIMDTNGMKNTVIIEGQKLKIPTLSDTQKSNEKASAQRAKELEKKYEGKLIHKVSSGEYLGGIAKKYNVSLTELMDKNSITDPRKIQIGQILIIKENSSQETAKVVEEPKQTAAQDASVATPKETVEQTAPNSKVQDLQETPSAPTAPAVPTTPETKPTIQDL